MRAAVSGSRCGYADKMEDAGLGPTERGALVCARSTMKVLRCAETRRGIERLRDKSCTKSGEKQQQHSCAFFIFNVLFWEVRDRRQAVCV